MPLDPSILLQSKPVQFEDPTALRMRALQLQGAQMSNDQAQKEVGDQRTLADLYKRNLSDDGSVNSQAMVGGMAQAGLGAKIPGYQKSLADSQKAQTESQTAQFDIHKKKLDYVNGVLSSLIQKPDLQQNDLITSINQMVNNGVIDANQGAQMARQIPGRPEQLRPFLIQKGLETMDASKRLEMMTPQYNEQDRGDVINQGTVDKLTGTRTPGADIKKSMTPDQAAKTSIQQSRGYNADESSLLAELALRSVSLPAGLRGQDQMKSTLRGMLDKYPDKLPSEIAEEVKSGKLKLTSETKASQVAGGQVGKVALAINEMKPFGEQVLEASSLLPRGEFVPYNQLKQYGEKQISSKPLLRFKVKMQALENAYNQLAARSGTDMDKRAHIHELFNVANSDEAVQTLVQALNEEGFGAKEAAQATVDELSKTPGSNPKPPLAAAAADIPADITALLNKHGAK